MKNNPGAGRMKAAWLCKRLKGRVRYEVRLMLDLDPLPVLNDETNARAFIAMLKKRKGQYAQLAQTNQRIINFMLGDSN